MPAPLARKVSFSRYKTLTTRTNLNDHRRLLSALEQRDAPLAKAIMSEYLRQVRELYFQLPNGD